MARSKLGAQTVIVVEQAVAADGSLTDTASTPVPGCLIQPTTGGPDQGEAVVNRFNIYGPPGLGVARSYHVLDVPGTVVGSQSPTVRLSMVGDADVWTGTDGVVDHVEAVADYIAGFGRQTVTVVHRVETSDGDWSETGRVTVSGCSVLPERPTEDRRARQQTSQRFRVHGPPALGLARGGDQLEVPGWVVGAPAVALLDMDGPASVWPDGNGAPHHAECSATLVEG